jgi:hypothetical protein
MSESLRQRILLIPRNLPLFIGGMERLNSHRVLELSKAADMRVVHRQDAGR